MTQPKPDQPFSILTPLRSNPIAAGIFLLILVYLLASTVFDQSPLDEDNLGGKGQAARNTPPPPPPTSVDEGERHMLDKVVRSVDIIRTAKRAQMCGLRGMMWTTRMQDLVYADEDKDKAKFRSYAQDKDEFDTYAKTLRDWEMHNNQPPHPSDYECANMPRSPEIDGLFRTEQELKTKAE